MKYFIGNTDSDWYDFLSAIKPENVNFWKPSGRNFSILSYLEPFLFRLKTPINKIAGGGFFTNSSVINLYYAWNSFGIRNGSPDFESFKEKIYTYKTDKRDPNIGCIILTNPIFFEEKDWIDIPSNFMMNVPPGNSYDTETEIGHELWEWINYTMNQYLNKDVVAEKDQFVVGETDTPMYRYSILKKIRIGQDTFKVSILENYKRQCSISGEKTLPVLEAAHIKAYSKSGPHYNSNGLLLRSDIHKLFDAGYITITNEHKIEVSKRIREEFENGKEYYKYHGTSLINLPVRIQDKPNVEYVEWHNTNVYRG